MQALFSGYFCPRDCDRKTKPDVPAKTTARDHCPKCASANIEPFLVPMQPTAIHCWDCGDVWSV